MPLQLAEVQAQQYSGTAPDDEPPRYCQVPLQPRLFQMLLLLSTICEIEIQKSEEQFEGGTSKIVPRNSK